VVLAVTVFEGGAQPGLKIKSFLDKPREI